MNETVSEQGANQKWRGTRMRLKTETGMTDAGYLKYEGMIRKKAWSFNKTTGIQFEELFAVASLGYCEAVKRYDGSKAGFSTYLYRVIDSILCTHVAVEKKRRVEFVPVDDEEIPEPSMESFVEREMMLAEFVDALSPQAQGVVNILFSCSEELTQILQSSYHKGLNSKSLKSALSTFLQKLGWKQKKIKSAFREIQNSMAGTNL